MNLSIDLLSDYNNLYYLINDEVLQHKRTLCSKEPVRPQSLRPRCSNKTLEQSDFELYLTPIDSANLSKQNSYLKNIYNKIDKLSVELNLNSTQEDDDEGDDDEDDDEEQNTNIIKTQKNSIKKKIGILKDYHGIIIFVLVMLILYYIYVLVINVNIAFPSTTGSGSGNNADFENRKFIGQYNMRSLYCNNINIIAVLSFLIETANNYKKNEVNKLEKEQDKLKDYDENAITNINSELTNIKTKLEPLVSGNNQLNSQNYNSKITEISENLKTFYDRYRDAKKVVNNNELMKEQKIKDINHLFTDFKHIIYKQENNFKDIIIDNSNNIYCLMNMILYKKKCNNEIESIKCSLNNKCGIKGLVDINSKTGFKNNLEIIDDNEIDIFFNKIKNETFNKNTKYELNNLNIFKVIKNIFISKIYHNDIEKSEFIKFIYNHFDKVNLKDENIEINKFDIILNYKSLINIIYNDYEIYKKTENKDKPRKIGNIISRARFNHILKYYNTTQMKEFRKNLQDTNDKIDEFKKVFKHEIYDDIKSRRNTNGYIKSFTRLILIISIIDFLCYFFEEASKLARSNIKNNISNSNDKIENNNNPYLVVLNLLRRISFIMLINMILYSYYYKNASFIDVQELIMQNNNNIFSKSLSDLEEKMSNMIIIKDIKDYKNKSDKSELNRVLKIYSIEAVVNNNKAIFSRYNSGDNYTILDEDDITNIVIEDFYYNLIEVMRLYECCSFLNRNPKVPLFPWTEFTINIIFVAITVLVATQLLISFNPMNLIEKIKQNMDNKITQKISNMDGGAGTGQGQQQQQRQAQGKSSIGKFIESPYKYLIRDGKTPRKIAKKIETEVDRMKVEKNIKAKELRLKELGYDKRKIKQFEKRKNETLKDIQSLADNINNYIFKLDSGIEYHLRNYNEEIDKIQLKINNMDFDFELDMPPMDGINSYNRLLRIKDLEKNKENLEKEKSIKKNELLNTMKKNAEKYEKIFNELTKNKDLNKILLDKLSSEDKPESIETYEEVLFLIENYEDFVNYVSKDSDTTINKGSDTKETSSKDEKFAKFANRRLQKVKIDKDFIEYIDTHFEDVLEKEYSINKYDFNDIYALLIDIYTKREKNSPENYELNAKYLLNGVIISLSLYYTYNIYWSTAEYQKNLYRI